MSKLSALLRRAGRAEPAPMGFAAAGSRAKPPEMLISAGLPGADPEAATAAVKAGADVILLESADLEGDAEKLKTLTGSVSVPCGLRISSPKIGAAEAARALGIDFLCISDQETPAAALIDDEMGFVLAAGEEAADSYLHVIGSTSFEALEAPELDETLSLRRQLALRRLSALTRKPIMLKARETVTSRELECLRDSGVAAVIAEMKGKSATRISAVRQTIAGMTPRRRPRTDRDSTALLPSVARTADGDDEEDD